MIFRCLFCDADISWPSKDHPGWFDCTKCPVHTRFIVSGDFRYPDVNYIHFRCWQWLIELNLDDKMTFIFDPNDRRFMTLNYLPDIDPSNAKEWLERLVKLKAFS